MPNLTVQEARNRVLYLMEGGEYTNTSENEAALAAYDAAHDAEGVEGEWMADVAGESLGPDSAMWFVERRDGDGQGWLECPNEATARAYARALNKADHSLKEGT